MKILLIQTAFLGDVILATSLIEKIKAYYPGAIVDFLLKKGNASLLTGNPHVRQVLELDKTRKYQSLVSLLLQVRQENYDKVININRYFSSGLLTAFSGAKERIGFRQNPFSVFFTTKVKHSFMGLHEVERNQQLIEGFTDKQPNRPKIYPIASDMKKVQPYLVKDPFITISAGSVWATKIYPLTKWIAFLDALESGLVVYFLGSKAETKAIQELIPQTHHNRVYNLTGILDLRSSGILMASARMNYANDSAPTHLGSAMNAPLSVLFTSTSPAFGYGPLSDKSFVIETHKKLPCRPCTNHGKALCPLGHYECGYSIRTEQLLETLQSVF